MVVVMVEVMVEVNGQGDFTRPLADTEVSRDLGVVMDMETDTVLVAAAAAEVEVEVADLAAESLVS